MNNKSSLPFLYIFQMLSHYQEINYKAHAATPIVTVFSLRIRSRAYLRQETGIPS